MRSLTGGIMLSMGWRPRQIFLAGAIPAFLAAVAIMLTTRFRARSNAYREQFDPGVIV